MGKPKDQTKHDAGAEHSAVESLRTLTQQHAALGERLARVAQQVEAEIETLREQAETCAAQLDEARGELVELRAALEKGMESRVIAETRASTLSVLATRMQSLLDEVMAENETPPVVEVAAGPEAPTVEDSAETWGMSEADLAALDALAAQEGAVDRGEMVRILCLRALDHAGLRSGSHQMPPDRLVGAGDVSKEAQVT